MMAPDGTVDNDILTIEHRLNLHRRQITPEQFRKFEGHVAEIFSTFGLEPHGVAVYLQAQHMCTQMRGVREVEPLTRTTFWRSVYDTTTGLRQEFLEISRWRPVPS